MVEVVEKLSYKDYELLKNCAYTWLSEYEDFVREEATVNGRIDEDALNDFHDRISATREAIAHAMQLLILNGLREPYVEFTDDEKAILRSLPETYNWISRSTRGQLTLHGSMPKRAYYDENGINFMWDDDTVNNAHLYLFNDIFKSVTPQIPIEFRKHL